MSSATRIDIVTVRDPDFANAYYIFVDGVLTNQDEPSGAYAEPVTPRSAVRVEVWDIDLGANDMTDPRSWGEDGPWWVNYGPDADGDITVAEEVRQCITARVAEAREKFLGFEKS